jgi:hypothetical protein
MEFQKWYSGKIVSMRQAHITSFGIRQYEVWLKGCPKPLFYEISSKRTFSMSVGDRIRFQGEYFGKNNQFFLITEVLDVVPIQKA